MKFLSTPWVRNVLRGLLVPLAIAGGITAVQCSDAGDTGDAGASLETLDEARRLGEVQQTVQSSLNLRALRAHCDFDGDGGCDYTYWQVPSGNWQLKKSSNGSTATQPWGMAEDIPVPNDYDGDGKTDYAIWRPSSGHWAVINSSNGVVQNPQWGTYYDIPVPADYDGDTKADFAIYRPTDGRWAVQKSNGTVIINQLWGAAEDIPVPADYDGDGKADIATYRPSNKQWAIILSSTGGMLSPAPIFGGADEIPVPADYDGDGKADRATWRPATGNWRIFSSVTNSALALQPWGAPEDIPVPGDWDKDRKADLAIWRPSTGHFAIKNSSGNPASTDVAWGAPGDVPVQHIRYRPAVKGDFDGDRKSDLATFRPSLVQWALRRTATGDLTVFGSAKNDLPAVADFDGDGKTDIGSYSPNTTWFRTVTSSNNQETLTGVSGRHDDVPAPGDYDGDRRADKAVYRYNDGKFYIICSATNAACNKGPWTLGTPVQADWDGDGKTDIATYSKTTTAGQWSILRTSNGLVRAVNETSAAAEDVPVPADFDGDGKADIARWRPSNGNWYITRSSTGVASPGFAWGATEDIPAPGDYDGDGKADIATWRPSTGNWAIIPSSTGVAWPVSPWGASEDIPLIMTVPARPWWYKPATLSTTLPAPTVVVGDTPTASPSAFWEFSALVAPPGTNGCPNGRRFLSGGLGGGYDDVDVLYKASLTCTGAACAGTNEINLLTNWGSGANGSVVFGDKFTADNTMARLPNGDLLISRDVLHALPSPVDKQVIFRSTNCGDTWTVRSFIDPSAKVGTAPKYPPPEYPGDPNASYGKPQDAAGAAGGWDREEIYANPFSTTDVYVTARASGGFNPNYSDTLFFRSTDSGQNWSSTIYSKDYVVVPVMMTAVPNRIYFYNCFGSIPVIRWSDDRGVTLSPVVPFAHGFHCQGSPTSWGIQGDAQVSRVSWSSNGDATLRVTFPDLNPNGDQVVRMFTVKVTNGVVTSKYIRTFETSGSHMIQMTAIEPDVSISPLGSTDNATLYYWKEMVRSTGVMKARGVIMKGETLTTAIFDVSTLTSTGGGSRTWPNNAKTGDYARGGFSYNTASARYEYFVPWIEVTSGGVYQMHTKVFGLPR